MSHALDARASVLPRSLAFSSLSYLTVVTLLLLARAVLPHAAPSPPIIDEGPPVPPDITNVVEIPPTPTSNTPPRIDPTAYQGELVVPAQDDTRVRDTLVARSAPSTVTGTMSGEHSGSNPNAGTVSTFDPDPPMDKYIFVETLPDLVKGVTPEYPSIARQSGMSGKVLLALQIGTDGRVRRVQVLQSSVMFDSAAVQAARQWVYTPATSDGHPVVVWVRQAVSFVLHD